MAALAKANDTLHHAMPPNLSMNLMDPKHANSKASTHDKQVRIDSDVKASAVHGHAVWLAHADGTISIRKVRTTDVVATIPPSTQRGRPWALLPVEVPGCKPAMWVGYSTGDIAVIDIESRTQLKLVCRHTGGVYCLAEFNGWVFSGSNDFEIVQWRAHDVSFVRQFTGHSNYVRTLHAEGSILVSGSDDHTVRVWNATNGQLVSIGRFHRTGISAMCRVGHDMWSADDDGVIAVWRLQTLEQEETLTEHTGRINALVKVGDRVYSASADHTVGVWEATTRSLIARIDEHRGWVTHLFAPAQLTRFYVWTAAADNTVRCWHHDEYRSCSRDVMRFADVQWFQAEYNPYRELNDELSQQVSRLEGQCAHLLQAYTTDHAHIEDCTATVSIMKQQVTEAETIAEQCRLQSKEAQMRIEQLLESTHRKEAELQQLSEATKSARNDGIEARCQAERLKAENEELRRQLDLCTSQRDKLSKALDETLALRSARGDPVPIIVTTAGDAAETLIKVQRELHESMLLNETLRDDLNRVSRVLAAATTSNVASSSAELRAGSPRPTDLALAKRLATAAASGHGALDAIYTVTARPPSTGASTSRRPNSSAGTAAGSSAKKYSEGAQRQFARGYVMDQYLAGRKK